MFSLLIDQIFPRCQNLEKKCSIHPRAHLVERRQIAITQNRHQRGRTKCKSHEIIHNADLIRRWGEIWLTGWIKDRPRFKLDPFPLTRLGTIYRFGLRCRSDVGPRSSRSLFIIPGELAHQSFPGKMRHNVRVLDILEVIFDLNV